MSTWSFWRKPDSVGRIFHRVSLLPLLIVLIGVSTASTIAVIDYYRGIRQEGPVAYLDQALDVLDDQSDRITNAESYYASLWIAMRAGEYEIAERGAFRLLGSRDHERYRSNVLYLMGMVSQRRGNLELSAGYFLKSLQLNQEEGKTTAHIRNELAYTAFLNGTSEQGVLLQGSDENLEGATLGRYHDIRSLLFLSLGDLESAKKSANLSLQAYTDVDQGGVYDALSTLALVGFCSGDMKSAQMHNREAYSLALQLQEPEKEMMLLVGVSLFHRLHGEPSPVEDQIKAWALHTNNQMVSLYLDRILELAPAQ